jgi:hypothetical protein
MMGYKILTAADKDYFGFASAMIKSATINFLDSSIYIELVNMDDKAKKTIESIGPQCEAEIVSIDFKNPNQKKCYCTNRRVDLFDKFRTEGNTDILIWIDADSLIRSSCDELKNIISSYDVSAVVRPPPTSSLRGGIIAVNNTEGADIFIKEYVRKMKKLNRWYDARDTEKIQSDPFTWEVWMSNQNCLDVLCRRDKDMRKNMSFCALSNDYCDVHLKDDGIIWAAKNRLKTSPIYLEELKKYEVIDG